MLFFWFLIIATSVRTQASKPVLAHQTTFRVHGSVTDARMTGLKGAELEFTGGVKRIVERTAGNGTFSVSLEPGNYTLSATAKGYCRSTQDLEVTANESDISLNIALLNCSDCPEMSIDFVQTVIDANAAPSTPSFPNGLVFKYQQEVLGDEQSA